MMMIAGPSVTRNKEGKINKTRGKTSLIVVFAACSSTLWRRWVLRVSEWMRSVLATLVPSCSDCTRTETRFRTLSTPVRSANSFQSSARLVSSPARCLIHAQSGFDANDHQIKHVGEAESNGRLTGANHPAEPEVGSHISQSCSYGIDKECIVPSKTSKKCQQTQNNRN